MTHEIQTKFKQRLFNTEIESEMIDFVIEEDKAAIEDLKKDSKVKDVPVSHFLIDLRYVMLKPHIERINKTYIEGT